jgi:serine/threonine protein kinase
MPPNLGVALPSKLEAAHRGADGYVEMHTGLAKKFHWKAQTFDAEVRALQSIESPWIVRLLASLPDSRCCCLELYDTDLMQVLLHGADSEVGSEAFRTDATLSLLKALDACHRALLVHRDVKPENVLVAASPRRFVLCDFGRSVSLADCPARESWRRFEGTYSYAAPEALQGRCTAANDCWSAGVVVYAVLERQMPFDETSDEEKRKLPRSPDLEETEPWPSWGRELLGGLLEKESHSRWSAARALAAVLHRDACVTDSARSSEARPSWGRQEASCT